jgi:hypothetical protein
MRKGFTGIGIVLGIVFFAVISVFGYKFGKEIIQTLKQSSFQSIMGRKSSKTPLFQGMLTRISEDLGLFTKTEEIEGYTPINVYYSAGVYTKGSYKGYERIIGLREPVGPGSPVTFTLATKDRKAYVLDDPTGATKRFPETDWQNPFQYIDKSKISKVGSLLSEQPETIGLNGSFALFRDTIVIENTPSGTVSPEGYEVYENRVQTDFSSYEKLSLDVPPLTFYGVINPPADIPEEWEEDAKVQAQLREKFIKGTTEVIVLDSTGLAYSYSLTRPQEIASYEITYKKYVDASARYEKERIRFENKEIKDLPDYPMMPSLPNLRFTKQDVKGGGELFNTYDIAVPYICGVDVDTPIIQNISDNEFIHFGTVFGQDLFTLKDPEHPFYKFAFRNKMLMSREEFDVINKDMKKLSYEEYVAKHPLLFLKDYWGRWTAVGEYDYKMIGGCGKPVLYLYPEEPTNVSVSFAKPMEITYSIPTYQSDWYVQAQPDGTLMDLVPELTDCTAIDTNKPGSEYAKSACETNEYPYLYWAGNRIGMSYPVNPHIGWIVSYDEIPWFLDTTLNAIGFTEKEKEDFLSYWVPVLLEKDAPWYHIRFLQTSDMNMFIPMLIRPTPDRYYRLFLDWRPLADKPAIPVAPQQLDTIVRKGFTVVEWGGLQQ